MLLECTVEAQEDRGKFCLLSIAQTFRKQSVEELLLKFQLISVEMHASKLQPA